MAPTSVGGNGVNPPPTPHLVLGTLSAVVGHPIKGYLPMPDWATVQPDGSAREPPKEEPRSLTGVYGDNDKSGKKSASGVGGDGNQLYSGRSSPESGSDSESDRNDTSSESSESGSYSSSEGSGSGSEGDASDFVSSSGDDDEDESGSSEGSGGSSAGSSIDDSDSSSPSSQGEEGVGLLIMGPGAASSAATYGASAPAPHSQDLTGLVERMSVVDREDSASPQLGARVEGLSLNSLSMAGVQGPRLVGAVGGGGISGTASAAQETIGLAGPPRVLGRSGSSTVSSSSAVDPGLDTSVSFPSTLLHHQAGGGLQVDYRYTRGRADVVSRPTTVLTMRLTLSNHRDNPIRRIRACPPRDATPMNAFPEVQELAAGATVDTHLGIDFGGRAKEVSVRLGHMCTWNCFSLILRPCLYASAVPTLSCNIDKKCRSSFSLACAASSISCAVSFFTCSAHNMRSCWPVAPVVPSHTCSACSFVQQLYVLPLYPFVVWEQGRMDDGYRQAVMGDRPYPVPAIVSVLGSLRVEDGQGQLHGVCSTSPRGARVPAAHFKTPVRIGIGFDWTT